MSALRAITLLLCAVSTLGVPAPSMTYSSNVFLDEAENIHMYWNHDTEYFTAEVHAQTTGYVSIGFSPGGKMEGADIIIGWVKDGKAYLQDRHAVGNILPSLDAKQDVELLMGKEENGYTVLKFRRRLDTCDPDHDLVITTGTIKMIWAHGATDPADENAIYYHGTSRGQRNIQLLGVVKKALPLPADTQSYEFRMKDYPVPSDDTTYACQVFKMPNVTQKNHIIQFEPVIKKGHEALVHHILIYACTPPAQINESFVNSQFFCHKDHHNMPWFRWHCESVILTWAVGGETFYFPENVGFSIGTAEDPGFLLMETHYDNPLMTAGQIDDSGLRIHYTPTLRTYDAGVLDQGKNVDSAHFIPPNSEDFKSYGICHTKCLNDALEDAPNKEINVFAVMLHAHLLGVGIKTYHIRDGVELAPLGDDKYYDFNYQTIMTLPEERTIKQNDQIITECTYRSTSRQNVTFGGLSSREEMCINFIYYWPRINMTLCTDRTSPWSVYPYLGITGVASDNVHITTPDKFANKTWEWVAKNGVDWSNAEMRTGFQQVEKFGLRNPVCRYRTSTTSEMKYYSELFNFTEPRQYWKDPNTRNCEGSNANGAGDSSDRISTLLVTMAVTILRFVRG